MHTLERIARQRPLACAANIVLLLALFAAIGLDRPIALWLANTPRHGVEFLFWAALTELGRAEPYIVLGLATYVWIKFAPRSKVAQAERRYWASHASLLLLSLAISGLLVNLAKPMIGRIRPRYLIAESHYGLEPLNFAQFGMNSFPSGHSQTIWAVAVVALLAISARSGGRIFSQRGPSFWLSVGICCVATAVAASRVLLNKHFVSDVLVGSLIGALIPLLLYPHWVPKR